MYKLEQNLLFIRKLSGMYKNLKSYLRDFFIVPLYLQNCNGITNNDNEDVRTVFR